MKKTPNDKNKKSRKSLVKKGLPAPRCFEGNEHDIEYRYSDKSSFKITAEALENCVNRALSMNKIPKLIIGIKRNDKEYFLLNCEITTERKDR